MSNPEPKYDLRPCHLDVVRDLCARFHGYKSAGNASAYAFAVYEDGEAVAGYAWQPPPTGCARAVCPEVPGGVLALSRMVAVDRGDRAFHVSRPLRRQMRTLIDRGRWPVLVTFSDEGQGHTGHVYKCSGWQPTHRGPRPVFEDSKGRRASSYSNGKHGGRADVMRAGSTVMQRWEHWA
ncbi:MAG: Mom family adenine methylcarbamoylation protein, partial [Acidiferrobacteraceae bacterium]